MTTTPDADLLILEPRERDLGEGFTVRRVLPAGKKRAVGPFLFFDHFGLTFLPPGGGLDVRPHPHINLATVTYLFEGEILHRDSLGSVQAIRAGDVNWMMAGRGIVHSERTAPELRVRGTTVHGLQLCVGLPREHEETALSSSGGARFVVVGGAPFPEPRHLWWNFVSTSRERLERAKRDWAERRGEPGGPFPLVPGDDAEFIPLPVG